MRVFLSELLSIIGLTLAGGLLLLWVCWKMFRELCGRAHQNGLSSSAPSAALWRAVARMVVADALLTNLLERLPWIAWLGLLIVVFVAFDMICRGIYEIEPHLMV